MCRDEESDAVCLSEDAVVVAREKSTSEDVLGVEEENEVLVVAY